VLPTKNRRRYNYGLGRCEAMYLPLLLLFTTRLAIGQDERRVTSPNGELEFRLAVAQTESGGLFRLAYQVFWHRKRLIDTSFLGLSIRFQEPLLGENVGLTQSRVLSDTGRYRSLITEYMQNGSLGRRIDVEVRVANDGIAFRYVIPRSSPLEELLLEDETTEFAFGEGGTAYLADGRGVELGRIEEKARLGLPLVVEQPGVGWVGISEVGTRGYPRAYLARSEGTVLITRLAAQESAPGLVFEGATPLTCPWRVVVVGRDRKRLMEAEILKGLGR
jgi:alpha-glucosidase